MTKAPGRSPRISYIIGTYPSLTTTFIDREIEGLLDRGADLVIVSIRPPYTDLSDRQRALQRHVSYLLPPQWLELAVAIIGTFVRRPVTTVRLVAYLLTRPHRNASRLRTLMHFVTGIYAAHRLRDRRGVHIHAHFVDRAATVALVASRLLGSTYSVTAHANDIYVKPTLLPAKFGNASFAVTCTEYNRRHLDAALGTPIARRIERIYHGLELDELRPIRPEQPKVPGLLSVGQLKEKKGLRYLVEALGLLSVSPLPECEIVGEGPLRADLQRQIDQLGLTGRVRLVGAQPHRSVVARYAQRPVFVLPCVVAADGDRDGIPNVILEAMAMELAVISTPISGIPEVVADGVTGLLVPPGDAAALAEAIQRALADDQLRARLGRAARAFVLENFEQGRNVERLMQRFAAYG